MIVEANLYDPVPELQFLPGVIRDVPQGDCLPPGHCRLVISPLNPLLDDVGKDNLAIATSSGNLHLMNTRSENSLS